MTTSHIDSLLTLEKQVSDLDQQLTNGEDSDSESGSSGTKRGAREKVENFAKEVCKVIRDASEDASSATQMPSIVEKGQEILEDLVEMAYDRHDLCDFMSSYSHEDEGGKAPLVSDPELKRVGAGLGSGVLDLLAHFMGEFLGPNLKDRIPKAVPFNSTPKPHMNTTALARFPTSLPIPTIPSSSPSAQAVFYACCSITSCSIPTPIRLHTVPNSNVLILAGAGGWKNRDPVLQYFLTDTDEIWDDLPEDSVIDSGLLGIVYDLALDPQRKLIYAADDHRVKSFAYNGTKYIPKHTLKSNREGPLAVVDNGARILRAGLGGVDVWNVDSLPDHGPRGKKRIGRGTISTEDTWRDLDGGDEVELSTGTPCHTTINFADATMNLGTWHLPHFWSGESGQLRALCQQKNTRAAVLAMDLRDQGKVASRYLGHGREVHKIDTSEGDSNTFVTASGDGIVRLFDVREPLPCLSFEIGSSMEFTYTAAYVHVDGIPIIFSGGQQSQCIKAWDPRARAIVYELATGNNSVLSLAWDAPGKTLYAATECEYMDRMGYTHDYRQAKIRGDREEIQDHRKVPGSETTSGSTEGHDRDGGDEDEDVEMSENEEDEDEDGSDGDDDDDDDSDYDEEKCWPIKAYHNEEFFGYALDCGEHRLLRYKFGLEANPKVAPPYGYATVGRSSFW